MNPGHTAPESSMLITRLPSHPVRHVHAVYQTFAGLHVLAGVCTDVAAVVLFNQANTINNSLLTSNVNKVWRVLRRTPASSP